MAVEFECEQLLAMCDPNDVLHNACRMGSEKMVHFAVERGARSLHLGLMEACEAGHLTIIHFLCTLPDPDYITGFERAFRGGHINAIQLMADIHVRHEPDWNWGMIVACQYGQYAAVLFAIDNGATAWNHGLRIAREFKHESIAQLMIARGADSNSTPFF